eukprot:Pgem_evm1s19241
MTSKKIIEERVQLVSIDNKHFNISLWLLKSSSKFFEAKLSERWGLDTNDNETIQNHLNIDVYSDVLEKIISVMLYKDLYYCIDFVVEKEKENKRIQNNERKCNYCNVTLSVNDFLTPMKFCFPCKIFSPGKWTWGTRITLNRCPICNKEQDSLSKIMWCSSCLNKYLVELSYKKEDKT